MCHVYQCIFKLCIYCIEGKFGGCKLWQIRYKNTVGEINFGDYNVVSIEQSILAEETLANLWSFTKSANVSTLQSFPPVHTVYLYVVMQMCMLVQVPIGPVMAVTWGSYTYVCSYSHK